MIENMIENMFMSLILMVIFALPTYLFIKFCIKVLDNIHIDEETTVADKLFENEILLLILGLGVCIAVPYEIFNLLNNYL